MDVESAIHEVEELAAELGLASTKPSIVADRSNLVLALGGAVVARVAMATSLVRVGTAWLRREIEVTTHLAAEGARVTRPSTLVAPGPHERGGFIISFWEREDVVAERADPAEAGASLREIHRLLARYTGDLPTWGGFEEARQVLDRARRSGLVDPAGLRRLDAAWAVAERIVEGARARSASFQPVHGDAHIGNVLATSRGAVWADWEDAFVGPVEIDLACLRSKADLFGEEREDIDAMTAAYGGGVNVELVRDLGLVRNVQVIPWLAVFAERDPNLVARMRRRIDKLPP
jgi:aminoglycoside phosphotransferase (APT) family kinase protein